MRESDSETWELRDRGVSVARLVVTGTDQPWMTARIESAPGFDELRPLFDDDLRLLDRMGDDPSEYELAYARILDRVTLIKPNGRPVAEFLLHVDGDSAWWRWSDEPFG